MNSYSLMAIAERIQRHIDSLESEIQNMIVCGVEEWKKGTDSECDDYKERMHALEKKSCDYAIAFEVIKDFAFEDLCEAFNHVENGGFHYDLPF